MTINEQPLVSVIVPCYNGEAFAGRFLDSVLAQTYPRIELFIVDDGSTDRTAEVIRSYQDRFTEKGYILHYIYQEHAGQAQAVNRALNQFHGDFLTWFDSDDVMLPDSIGKRVRFLQDNPEFGFCMSQYAEVLEDDLDTVVSVHKRIPPQQGQKDTLFDDLLKCTNVLFPDVYMARSDAMLKAIPKRQIYPSVEGQNWQLLLPLSHYFSCGYLNEPLCKVVTRSASHSHMQRTPQEELQRNHNFIVLLTTVINELTEIDKDHYNTMVRVRYAKDDLRYALELNDIELADQAYELLHKTNSLSKGDKVRHFFCHHRYLMPVFSLMKTVHSLLTQR